jgi:hypothetical protein
MSPEFRIKWSEALVSKQIFESIHFCNDELNQILLFREKFYEEEHFTGITIDVSDEGHQFNQMSKRIENLKCEKHTIKREIQELQQLYDYVLESIKKLKNLFLDDLLNPEATNVTHQADIALNKLNDLFINYFLFSFLILMKCRILSFPLHRI